MQGIERQAERFAFADPELARLTDEREASVLPSDTEIEGMFSAGPSIHAGMLRKD